MTHQEGKDSEQTGYPGARSTVAIPQLELSRDNGMCVHSLPDPGAEALRRLATAGGRRRPAPRIREWVFAFPALCSAMTDGVSAIASMRVLAPPALGGAGACGS